MSHNAEVSKQLRELADKLDGRPEPGVPLPPSIVNAASQVAQALARDPHRHFAVTTESAVLCPDEHSASFETMFLKITVGWK